MTDRTLEGGRLHEPFLFEARERLAQRGLAHPELFGERDLPQRLAGAQPELDDRFAELLPDPVGHLPAVGAAR